MSVTTLSTFDSTLHTTNVWLKELREELGWEDRERAWHALGTVLHALRDHLTVDQAAALGAQLPLLVRGLYYEGWHPHGKPVRERHLWQFLARLDPSLRDQPDAGRKRVVRAVFGLLARHVSPGEAERLREALPPEVRALWP